MLTVPSSAGLPFQEEPRVVGTGRTASNEFEIRAARLAGDLSVADCTVPTPEVNVVDAFPTASLGSAFLRDYVVTFDVPNSRLALTR